MYPIRPFAISPAKGARTSIYLASESDIGTGDYYFRSQTSTPSVAARNDEAARRLWAISEELTARG